MSTDIPLFSKEKLHRKCPEFRAFFTTVNICDDLLRHHVMSVMVHRIYVYRQLFMIGFSTVDPAASVDLLQKDHTHQLMGKCHF